MNRPRVRPIDRAARKGEADRAVSLFNGGKFWEAHEAIETIWRSVGDEEEARVLQGLIQAAAALLHRDRGNSHGVAVVGDAALSKLSGRQHEAVEFETEVFRSELERALRRGGPPPTLRLRTQ